MDLTAQYPPNTVPNLPFVGLFGNHHNNWRTWSTLFLNRLGIDSKQIYDSTDPGWSPVNENSGDSLQNWINELVQRQHNAMAKAMCLIFSLDSCNREWNLTENTAIPALSNMTTTNLFAARCELGWLAGINKPAFVWIPDQLEGRNYLRAVINLYPHLQEVADLGLACQLAAKILQSDT